MATDRAPPIDPLFECRHEVNVIWHDNPGVKLEFEPMQGEQVLLNDIGNVRIGEHAASSTSVKQVLDETSSLQKLLPFRKADQFPFQVYKLKLGKTVS